MCRATTCKLLPALRPRVYSCSAVEIRKCWNMLEQQALTEIAVARAARVFWKSQRQISGTYDPPRDKLLLFDGMPYQFRNLVRAAGHYYECPDVWDSLRQNKSKSIHAQGRPVREHSEAPCFCCCFSKTSEKHKAACCSQLLHLQDVQKTILQSWDMMRHVGAHTTNAAQNLVPDAQKSCHDQVA